MTSSNFPAPQASITLSIRAIPIPGAQNPVLVYLGRLTSPHSKRTMGRADVKTTKRYDRRPEQVKQLAAGKIRLPYRRRPAARA